MEHRPPPERLFSSFQPVPPSVSLDSHKVFPHTYLPTSENSQLGDLALVVSSCSSIQTGEDFSAPTPNASPPISAGKSRRLLASLIRLRNDLRDAKYHAELLFNYPSFLPSLVEIASRSPREGSPSLSSLSSSAAAEALAEVFPLLSAGLKRQSTPALVDLSQFAPSLVADFPFPRHLLPRSPLRPAQLATLSVHCLLSHLAESATLGSVDHFSVLRTVRRAEDFFFTYLESLEDGEEKEKVKMDFPLAHCFSCIQSCFTRISSAVKELGEEDLFSVFNHSEPLASSSSASLPSLLSLHHFLVTIVSYFISLFNRCLAAYDRSALCVSSSLLSFISSLLLNPHFRTFFPSVSSSLLSVLVALDPAAFKTVNETFHFFTFISSFFSPEQSPPSFSQLKILVFAFSSPSFASLSTHIASALLQPLFYPREDISLGQAVYLFSSALRKSNSDGKIGLLEAIKELLSLSSSSSPSFQPSAPSQRHLQAAFSSPSFLLVLFRLPLFLPPSLPFTARIQSLLSDIFILASERRLLSAHSLPQETARRLFSVFLLQNNGPILRSLDLDGSLIPVADGLSLSPLLVHCFRLLYSRSAHLRSKVFLSIKQCLLVHLNELAKLPSSFSSTEEQRQALSVFLQGKAEGFLNQQFVRQGIQEGGRRKAEKKQGRAESETSNTSARSEQEKRDQEKAFLSATSVYLNAQLEMSIRSIAGEQLIGLLRNNPLLILFLYLSSPDLFLSLMATIENDLFSSSSLKTFFMNHEIKQQKNGSVETPLSLLQSILSSSIHMSSRSLQAESSSFPPAVVSAFCSFFFAPSSPFTRPFQAALFFLFHPNPSVRIISNNLVESFAFESTEWGLQLARKERPLSATSFLPSSSGDVSSSSFSSPPVLFVPKGVATLFEWTQPIHEIGLEQSEELFDEADLHMGEEGGKGKEEEQDEKFLSACFSYCVEKLRQFPIGQREKKSVKQSFEPLSSSFSLSVSPRSSSKDVTPASISSFLGRSFSYQLVPFLLSLEKRITSCSTHFEFLYGISALRNLLFFLPSLCISSSLGDCHPCSAAFLSFVSLPSIFSRFFSTSPSTLEDQYILEHSLLFCSQLASRLVREEGKSEEVFIELNKFYLPTGLLSSAASFSVPSASLVSLSVNSLIPLISSSSPSSPSSSPFLQLEAVSPALHLLVDLLLSSANSLPVSASSRLSASAPFATLLSVVLKLSHRKLRRTPSSSTMEEESAAPVFPLVRLLAELFASPSGRFSALLSLLAHPTLFPQLKEALEELLQLLLSRRQSSSLFEAPLLSATLSMLVETLSFFSSSTSSAFFSSAQKASLLSLFPSLFPAISSLHTHRDSLVSHKSLSLAALFFRQSMNFESSADSPLGGTLSFSLVAPFIPEDLFSSFRAAKQILFSGSFCSLRRLSAANLLNNLIILWIAKAEESRQSDRPQSARQKELREAQEHQNEGPKRSPQCFDLAELADALPTLLLESLSKKENPALSAAAANLLFSCLAADWDSQGDSRGSFGSSGSAGFRLSAASEKDLLMSLLTAFSSPLLTSSSAHFPLVSVLLRLLVRAVEPDQEKEEVPIAAKESFLPFFSSSLCLSSLLALSRSLFPESVSHSSLFTASLTGLLTHLLHALRLFASLEPALFLHALAESPFLLSSSFSKLSLSALSLSPADSSLCSALSPLAEALLRFLLSACKDEQYLTVLSALSPSLFLFLKHLLDRESKCLFSSSFSSISLLVDCLSQLFLSFPVPPEFFSPSSPSSSSSSSSSTSPSSHLPCLAPLSLFQPLLSKERSLSSRSALVSLLFARLLLSLSSALPSAQKSSFWSVCPPATFAFLLSLEWSPLRLLLLAAAHNLSAGGESKQRSQLVLQMLRTRTPSVFLTGLSSSSSSSFSSSPSSSSSGSSSSSSFLSAWPSAAARPLSCSPSNSAQDFPFLDFLLSFFQLVSKEPLRANWRLLSVCLRLLSCCLSVSSVVSLLEKRKSKEFNPLVFSVMAVSSSSAAASPWSSCAWSSASCSWRESPLLLLQFRLLLHIASSPAGRSLLSKRFLPVYAPSFLVSLAASVSSAQHSSTLSFSSSGALLKLPSRWTESAFHLLCFLVSPASSSAPAAPTASCSWADYPALLELASEIVSSLGAVLSARLLFPASEDVFYASFSSSSFELHVSCSVFCLLFLNLLFLQNRRALQVGKSLNMLGKKRLEELSQLVHEYVAQLAVQGQTKETREDYSEFSLLQQQLAFARQLMDS